MPAEYYEQTLYPLQNKVIGLFRDTPFYLTGGTALSRGYYNHRYSDDLDYFVNDHHEFMRIADRQIDKLRKTFDAVSIVAREDAFVRIFVPPAQLKIEMINDVPSHVGGLVDHPLLGIIDSKENILANKLTALLDRALPKDIVDIYFLLKDGIDFRKSVSDAESKAAGTSPLLIAKMFEEFDYSIIDSAVKWVALIDYTTIQQFLHDVCHKIVKGEI